MKSTAQTTTAGRSDSSLKATYAKKLTDWLASSVDFREGFLELVEMANQGDPGAKAPPEPKTDKPTAQELLKVEETILTLLEQVNLSAVLPESLKGEWRPLMWGNLRREVMPTADRSNQ